MSPSDAGDSGGNSGGITAILAYLDAHPGLASWALVLIGLATAIFGVIQMLHARGLRVEQTRPYVFVSMREVKHGIVELYVKNIGSTAAQNITYESVPPLDSMSDPSEFYVFDKIPTLVPGEEWSTLWETRASMRSQQSAVQTYTVTLNYEDQSKRPRTYSGRFVLDWRTRLRTWKVVPKTVDDIGDYLERIADAYAPKPRQVTHFGRSSPLPEPVPEPKLTLWRRVVLWLRSTLAGEKP